jgi:hypothetical protein
MRGCERRPGGRSKGSADLSSEPLEVGWLGMRLVQRWDGTGAGETILEETDIQRQRGGRAFPCATTARTCSLQQRSSKWLRV